MKMKTLALATVLVATSVPAAAQVTTYGDQGSFAAASGPLTTETFSSCPGNNTGFSDAVSSTFPHLPAHSRTCSFSEGGEGRVE